MVSFVGLAASLATLCFSAASTPERSTSQLHQVHQVPNPRFSQRDGPSAYAKVVAKYGHLAPNSHAVISTGGNVTTSVNAKSSDSQYLSPITIGNQTFNVQFDTGSSDLWVFGPNSQAGSHNRYAPSNTSTPFKGEFFSIKYGGEDGAQGPVYCDTVVVGTLKVDHQAIGAAANVVGFQQEPEDGLMGLGFDALNTISPHQQRTVVSNAAGQGFPNIFAVDLIDGKAGRFDFGGIDPSYATSDITYARVNSSEGFWSFKSKAFTVGNNCTTISANNRSDPVFGFVDTGTSLLLLPETTVEAYYGQVKGASFSDVDQGYVFPCNASLPSLTITIRHHDAIVPGPLLNFSAGTAKGSCFGGLQETPLQQSIYGDVFLQAQYVVFDRSTGRPRLGFANKAGTNATQAMMENPLCQESIQPQR